MICLFETKKSRRNVSAQTRTTFLQPQTAVKSDLLTFPFCSSSWRGAMIEAEQVTEVPPSADGKEAAAPPSDLLEGWSKLLTHNSYKVVLRTGTPL